MAVGAAGGTYVTSLSRHARTPSTARSSRPRRARASTATPRRRSASRVQPVRVASPARRRASTRHASDQEGGSRCDLAVRGPAGRRCWPSSLVATIVAACDSAGRGGSAAHPRARRRARADRRADRDGGARDRHSDRVRPSGRPGRRAAPARRRRRRPPPSATLAAEGGDPVDRPAGLVHLDRRRLRQPVAARRPDHGRRRRAADRHARPAASAVADWSARRVAAGTTDGSRGDRRSAQAAGPP